MQDTIIAATAFQSPDTVRAAAADFDLSRILDLSMFQEEHIAELSACAVNPIFEARTRELVMRSLAICCKRAALHQLPLGKVRNSCTVCVSVLHVRSTPKVRGVCMLQRIALSSRNRVAQPWRNC